MPKSFDITFDAQGHVVIDNIQGVEGTACLDLTRPYVQELEDKSNPAETLLHDAGQVYALEDGEDIYNDL